MVRRSRALQDEDIRQGVKQHSEWPTYPQLYVDAELVGGCDIILELSLIHISEPTRPY